MNISEEQLLPLSALQHMAFCPRQCALIHIEQAWQENRYTAEGRVLHEKTDTPEVECRPGIRIVRAMMIHSFSLGVSGKCDVVEYHRNPDGTETILPVEYKRGRPKPDERDEVQLCAQAVCLEEMHQTTIARGILYYGTNRRRKEIQLSDDLRRKTRELAESLHTMYRSRQTPAPHYEPKKCDACSLYDLCCPKSLDKSATRHHAAMLRHALEDSA